MDILPSEEEQMVKNLAREFLEGECPTSLVREMEVDDLGYSPDLWKKMSAGLMHCRNVETETVEPENGSARRWARKRGNR